MGSSAQGTADTLERLLAREQEIVAARLDLLVMPEALLGGYPKGADFGTRVGYRTPGGRDQFLAYWEQAIDREGPEVAELCSLARRTSTAFVVGATERAGATLYCSALHISDAGELTGCHRKLVPTAAERLVWGQGDGRTLPTLKTRAGLAGSAVCWENYMPQLRQALHAKGVTLWCAPTVDDRDIWQVSMRHIAYEMRSFVISACQFQPASTEVFGQRVTLRDRAEDQPMIRGGSCIISPFGEVLAGPLYDTEGMVVADICPADVIRARFDLDISGHYARPDVFGPSAAND